MITDMINQWNSFLNVKKNHVDQRSRRPRKAEFREKPQLMNNLYRVGDVLFGPGFGYPAMKERSQRREKNASSKIDQIATKSQKKTWQ